MRQRAIDYPSRRRSRTKPDAANEASRAGATGLEPANDTSLRSDHEQVRAREVLGPVGPPR